MMIEADSSSSKAVTIVSDTRVKKVYHYLGCRLNEDADFNISSPTSLVSAGFASIAVGLLTLFRPSPVLLYCLVTHLRFTHYSFRLCRTIIVFSIFMWLGIVLFVLLILGFLLVFSVRIKKRGILLLHPWGLSVLYVDAVVWLTVTGYLHITVYEGQKSDSEVFDSSVYDYLTYLIVIYIENCIYCVCYFVYTTYFIVAELTVIERFY